MRVKMTSLPEIIFLLAEDKNMKPSGQYKHLIVDLDIQKQAGDVHHWSWKTLDSLLILPYMHLTILQCENLTMYYIAIFNWCSVRISKT